jgi:hypothetical protein
VVGAAWGLGRIGRLRSPDWVHLAGVVVTAPLLALQVPLYRLSPSERLAEQYGELGPTLAQAQPAASAIDKLLAPGEAFFTWSDEAWLYAATGRRPPAVVLWRQHAEAGTMADWLTARSLERLEQNPPELVVVWRTAPPATSHPIDRWIENHYHPIPDRAAWSPFRLLARNGGTLERRLSVGLTLPASSNE